MINYEIFSKEELILFIHHYIRAIEYYIWGYDDLIDVFHYLDGVQIDCPEKQAQLLIKEVSTKALEELNKAGKLIVDKKLHGIK